MKPASLLSPQRYRPLLAGALLLLAAIAHAQEAQLEGAWVINQGLSDNTDKQVEAALRAAGERVSRSWFSRDRERYRGGPPEQELYDRMSYDMVLEIRRDGDHYEFEYADDFAREVFTDNRSRSVSLSALDSVKDFSVGHWVNDRFVVEAHARDGGSTDETYTLLNGGAQLKAEFFIRPSNFSKTIELTRVYDRVK